MDLHLKHRRGQQKIESEVVDEHPSASKFPRLLSEANNHYHHHHDNNNNNNNNNEEKIDEPALPLFVPEPATSSKINCSYNFSAYTSDCSTRFPITAGIGGGSYFSMAQWQELELQAVIFRHMMAGSAVPPELLQLIKKSPSYYFHQQNYPFIQPTLLQAASGYWGRGSMDPEPGRCRRTDGKKWRCSRDVVPGQKYCERHVHRGRNRSRKPVEFPTNTTTVAAAMNHSATAGISYPFGAGSGGGDAANDGGDALGTPLKSTTTFASPSQLASTGGGSHFSLSGPYAPFDVLQFSQGSAELKRDKKEGCFDSQLEASGDHGSSSGRVLRRFFDDWPRGSNHGGNNTGPGDSATCLSISTPGGGGNSTSDFLKLSTGNGEEEVGGRGAGDNDESGDGQPRVQQGQLSWNSVVGWGTNHHHHHHHHQMGGPLAEALRSSAAATTNNSSPTSVLHQLQRCSASADTNYVSA